MDQISISGPATPAEAAAVSAAIERFLGDTAVGAPPAGKSLSPWARAALTEGVSSKDPFGPGDPGDLI